MCVTSGPAVLSSTIVFGNRAKLDDRDVHVLGYQNVASDMSGRPNAMILPIPAASRLGPDNMLDTRGYSSFMRDYAEELRPRMRGGAMKGMMSLSAGVQVFTRGSYTVVLVNEILAAQVLMAIDALPEVKRPGISDSMIDAFAVLYPGWQLAICCWSGDIKPEPLLWYYEPAFDELFLPGLDAHDGNPPDLSVEVETDHTLVFGADLTGTGGTRPIAVDLPRTDDARVKRLLPSRIAGRQVHHAMTNGDWWVDHVGTITRRSPTTVKQLLA